MEIEPEMHHFRAIIVVVLLCFLMLILQAGCQSPSEHRSNADDVAYRIIEEKQRQSLGEVEEFSIERPSDILRRRLLAGQGLSYSGGASLGTDQLEPIEHWPEKGPPKTVSGADPNESIKTDEVIQLSLIQTLQVGARNSFEYQLRKEDVFRAALDLDLELDWFRNTFAGQLDSVVSTSASGDRTVSGTEYGGSTSWTKKLKNGISLGGGLAVDLVNLLTLGGASSLGIMADATITVPLLRGSGEHIVTESLTQAERNVVYAIYEFEMYKRSFAVDIAREYMAVLERIDQKENVEENYKSSIASARSSRRLADAGRLPAIQVDQAVQSELRARNRWISAQESYKRSIDSFKNLLGLPPDAGIELDRSVLNELVGQTSEIVEKIALQEAAQEDMEIQSANAPIELVGVSHENAGPLEIDESLAIKLALDNRLDLRISQGGVYDAQRAVVIAADALGAELTFFGSADFGSGRSISSATADDAKLRADKGAYSGLLTLDLPIERTAERNAYRKSLIALERAVRQVQQLEDQIKLSVRNKLRDLLEARETIQIQAQSVWVAEKRVKSSNLFLEAGRAQMRDLLEAQDALLTAQNGLTSAVTSYRVAELELQRDMGLLKVDKNGLWQEYSPEGTDNVRQ